MLASRSWITDFVDLQGISDEKFSREMTFSGNKVETVHKFDGESVYEFEITSNRPDTLSVIGLAREAAAVFDQKLTLPKTPNLPNPPKIPIRLTVSDKKLCPVYSIVEVSGVTVQPSSPLIQKRLTVSGIRPVNNVVDVTNYVMLETGQPMHAFDADRTKGSLTLRGAKNEESIVPLDHKERVLAGGEIIIEDREKLVDLAGLMGGLNTEISQETTRVLLLVPIYDPVAIRRASKFLRLRTEASTRFEKKLDLSQTETVARRAVTLLTKETGGKQSTRIVTEKKGSDLPERSDPSRPIPLSPERLSKLVGIPISDKEITRQLKKVGIEKMSRGFLPPPWRRDIERDVDLVEEVTRLYGFNKLPKTLPVGDIPTYPDALAPNWRCQIAELIASLGYTETYGSTLTSRTEIERLGFSREEHLNVLHPMSEDYEYLRRSMLTTLVPFFTQNLLHRPDVRLFELGTVFHSTHDDELPEQPLELGIIATSSYEQMKGDVEYLLRQLGIIVSWHEKESTNSRFLRLITISAQGSTVGSLVLLHPQLVEQRTEQTVWAATLNCSLVIPKETPSTRYPRLSDYPPIIEDVTLVRPEKGYLAEAISMIKDASPLVTTIECVGTFKDAVTLRLTFQSYDRNLTQEEVNSVKESVLRKLSALGWTPRQESGRSTPG